MKAVILLGGPGAGKGTMAEKLKEQKGYLHVSTGDILRSALKSGSDVGLKVKSYMDSGALVPDSVVMDLIKDRVAQEPDDASFLFDGFPRTLAQAEGLQTLISEVGGKIDSVINLNVERDALIRRLTARRTCKTCGAIYHLVNMPPRVAGICDVDGGELYQRADDCEATILNRLEVYENQTKPLIGYYRELGLLRDVDAGGSIDGNFALVLSALNG